jgi:hypothetical protein
MPVAPKELAPEVMERKPLSPEATAPVCSVAGPLEPLTAATSMVRRPRLPER